MGNLGDFFEEKIEHVTGWTEDKIDTGIGLGEEVAEGLGLTSPRFGEAGYPGSDDPAIRAAEIAAGSQEKALEYLKEREALPGEIREGALRELAGIYGLSPQQQQQQQPGGQPETDGWGLSKVGLPMGGFLGGVPGGRMVDAARGTLEGAPSAGQIPVGDQPITPWDDQGAFIEKAIQSPLYQSLIGGREAGEEAILRNAAATGGLRSGGIQESLYDYNTQLQNKAMLESYNQQLGLYQQKLGGLSGLAGLPSMAPQIAQGISGIGQTQAQGQMAAYQNMLNRQQQQSAQQQQGFGNMMGLGQLGLGIGSLALAFSDRRLKQNIKKIGEVKGHNWYSWDWNVVGNKMGLAGSCEGVLADEVFETRPDAILMKDNFMMVNYTRLIGMVPILEEDHA
jgi:hypothetical protein